MHDPQSQNKDWKMKMKWRWKFRLHYITYFYLLIIYSEKFYDKWGRILGNVAGCNRLELSPMSEFIIAQDI